MRVGIPRELKSEEHRVAMSPAGAAELVARGHDVLVEAGAGLGSGIDDDQYAAAGARCVPKAEMVWDEAELVLKVKEPVAEEHGLLRAGQTLFTFLHLAADLRLAEALLSRGTTAIAYETVQAPDGSLPLLAPMSEIAGRLAPQVGAVSLMSASGGRGVLLSGAPGVHAGTVTVLGAGTAGMAAATIALGMRARVVLLDSDPARLRAADRTFAGAVQTVASSHLAVERAVLDADLVVGAVLVPGARTPRLVSNDLVSRMRPGSVLVDVSVDQGGCFEDSHPTTHDAPTYLVHDSIFYSVANMPGAVPHTATEALTAATLPYVLRLADAGWREALRTDRALASGLNVHAGWVTHPGVAAAHGIECVPVRQVLG